jgi:hypothetical protein
MSLFPSVAKNSSISSLISYTRAPPSISLMQSFFKRWVFRGLHFTKLIIPTAWSSK